MKKLMLCLGLLAAIAAPSSNAHACAANTYSSGASTTMDQLYKSECAVYGWDSGPDHQELHRQLLHYVDLDPRQLQRLVCAPDCGQARRAALPARHQQLRRQHQHQLPQDQQHWVHGHQLRRLLAITRQR
jgi:hypothetical protein